VGDGLLTAEARIHVSVEAKVVDLANEYGDHATSPIRLLPHRSIAADGPLHVREKCGRRGGEATTVSKQSSQVHVGPRPTQAQTYSMKVSRNCLKADSSCPIFTSGRWHLQARIGGGLSLQPCIVSLPKNAAMAQSQSRSFPAGSHASGRSRPCGASSAP